MEKLTELWGQFPDSEPRTTDSMLAQMRKEEIDGFFIMGANPVMLYPDRTFAYESLDKLDFLVVCDLFETATTELADVVLPMCSWAEHPGDYINLEGRVQTSNQAINPLHESKAPVDIMKLIAEKLETPLFDSDEQMRAEIESVLGVGTERALPEGYLEVKPVTEEEPEEYPVAAMLCDDPHHSGHYSENNPSLANFCSEAYIELSSDLAAKLDVKDGDPVRVKSEAGKVVVPARISEHVDSDVVLLPRNFSATAVNSLFMRRRRVDRVKLTKVVD